MYLRSGTELIVNLDLVDVHLLKVLTEFLAKC